MLELYGEFCTKYPVVTIEDPFEQDDWDPATKLTAEGICQVGRGPEGLEWRCGALRRVQSGARRGLAGPGSRCWQRRVAAEGICPCMLKTSYQNVDGSAKGAVTRMGIMSQCAAWGLRALLDL